jgi:HD-GYP domain-containing protein (c-di-GMP phosphodiesterase class II)
VNPFGYRPELERLPSAAEHTPSIRSLLLMMAAKHRPTYLHLCQVSAYCRVLAHFIGLPEEQVDLAAQAGLLHDIGKAAVPDAILTKPGPLTDDELQVMTDHPNWSAELVAKSGDLGELVGPVLYHHEWFDGRGYPKGLSGNQIPLLSRMIAVADAYDTMTTPRPYRMALPSAAALSELKRWSRAQFDPELVEAFVEMIQQSKEESAEVSSEGEPGNVRRTLPLALRLSCLLV